MLRKLTLLIFLLFIGILAGEMAMTNSSGPPAGYTGAPGELNCTSCHSGSPINPGNATRTLEFNGTPGMTSYVPNQTYTVVYTVSNPLTSVFGFQLIAKTNTGIAGTLIATDPVQTQLSSGYLQHTFAGSQASPAGTKSWSFSWTAPPMGSGLVTFYVATNVANGNGSDSGDEIYVSAYPLTEGVASNSITSPSMNPNGQICAGGAITLNFSTTGVYSAGNVFQAQLSDATGSFSNPVIIGSLSSVSGGTINGTIPANTLAGSLYRIRIVSTQPVANSVPSSQLNIQVPAAAPTLSYDGRVLSGTGSGTFVWFRNGNPISGATASTYTPTQTGTYMVGIENTICSPSLSNTVQVTALITALQQPTTPAVCEGSTLFRGFNTEGIFDANNEFTLQLIDASGVETSLPTTTPSSSSLVAVLPAGVSGFGYRYRLRSSNPLALSAISDTFNIVATPPAATITQNGLVLSSSASTGNLWYKDGQAISGADQPTYTVTENGSYYVQYVSSNCQSPPSNSIDFTNVSVVDHQQNAFRFYPNPAQAHLQVIVPDRGQLQLRDLTGKILMETSFEAGEHAVELNALAAGVYVLVWNDARGSSQQRFVKQ